MSDVAAQIDNFLKGYGSPMAGLGSVYVAAGKKYGVDPRLVAAISGAESSFGKHVPGGTHNAWGWGPGEPFDSWQEGIATVTRGLKSGYIDQGRVTPAQIVPKYAPGSDGNDETHWSGLVSQFMKELGSSPASSTAKTVTQPSVTQPAVTTRTVMSAVPSSSPVPSTLGVLAAISPLLNQQPTFSGVQRAALENLNEISTRGRVDPVGMLQSLAEGRVADVQQNQANASESLLRTLAGLESLAPTSSHSNDGSTTTTTTTTTTPSTPSTPPTPATPPSSDSAKTVWPYASDVYQGRTDQGVDWIQSKPYLAPKSGTIVKIDPNWYNGTPSIYLQFDQPVTINGRSYPGVFFAETSVIPGMKVGDRIAAGQPIAGGSPSGSLGEQGFAAPSGSSGWMQAAYGHYSEGQQTQAGQDFRDWLARIQRSS